ncbi:MAG: SIMPL domain-containing protein, partial [Proteobacteria bacterium]|nr:SIMPL domain-containing protein [Pseudomonadota bacterium]
MKPLKFLVAASALAAVGLASGSAMAQNVSPVPVIAQGSTLLTVSADGKSTRTPDLAVFNAGVTTQGQTAGDAMSANATAMNKVFSALKKAGIAEKDVQTSNINLNPIYGQQVVEPNGNVTREPRIVGYQATNSVSVRQRDLKAMGKVLDALVSAGANNINGPSFQIDNADAAQDEARTAAVTKARARANLYAKAAGLRVVRIVSISESGGY